MRGNRPVGAIVLEAALVALGVLLALFANEWQQERLDREDAMEVRESIIEELKANRAIVAESQEYHQGRLRILFTASSAADIDGARDFPKGFISPARLLDVAWESAKATDALRHLPLDQVLAAGEIYSQQERYDQQVTAVSALIYGRMFSGGPGAILENPRGLGSVVSTFQYREQEMLGAYDQALEALGHTTETTEP